MGCTSFIELAACLIHQSLRLLDFIFHFRGWCHLSYAICPAMLPMCMNFMPPASNVLLCMGEKRTNTTVAHLYKLKMWWSLWEWKWVQKHLCYSIKKQEMWLATTVIGSEFEWVCALRKISTVSNGTGYLHLSKQGIGYVWEEMLKEGNTFDPLCWNTVGHIVLVEHIGYTTWHA